MTITQVAGSPQVIGRKIRIWRQNLSGRYQKRIQSELNPEVFKQAIGGLYKQGKIKITDDGIELVR